MSRWMEARPRTGSRASPGTPGTEGCGSSSATGGEASPGPSSGGAWRLRRFLRGLSVTVRPPGEGGDLAQQLVQVERLGEIGLGVQAGGVPLHRAIRAEDQ